MTDEAVASEVEMTIQTRTFRRRRRKFCAGFFGDRISFVWHPSGMRALRVSRSGGVVAGAPQPPANVCDPYRGHDEAASLGLGAEGDDSGGVGFEAGGIDQVEAVGDCGHDGVEALGDRGGLSR